MSATTHAIHLDACPQSLTHADFLRVHRLLCEGVRAVGARLEAQPGVVWEGASLHGDHLWSANDLEATALLIRYVAERLPQSGLTVDVGFLTEELSLVPYAGNGQPLPATGNGHGLFLHIDPIDGSKAFDNWKCAGDCPLPRPGSAISVAAVCPRLDEIVASALYCFDLGEVFSSLYVGSTRDGAPQYAAFRNGTLLRLVPPFQDEPQIEAKRRLLCGNYNSQALVDLAHLELALMERGLKGAYGGLTGSTATDIINVVRGSFCACLDIRALCGRGGSVPYWYDAAGAFPIAQGRGLRVLVTDAQGVLLQGGNQDIYTPMAFVVARSEVVATVVEAIQRTVCPGFCRDAAL